MANACRIDAVAAQAVDVLSPKQILEGTALADPLDGGMVAGLGHGLAVLQKAWVIVVGEIAQGVLFDTFSLLHGWVYSADDVQVALTLGENLRAGRLHEMPPLVL